MNKWGMKGIVLGLCLSMMAPMAVAMVPGMSMEAVAAEDELLKKAKEDAPKELADYKRLIDPDNKFVWNIISGRFPSQANGFVQTRIAFSPL